MFSRALCFIVNYIWWTNITNGKTDLEKFTSKIVWNGKTTSILTQEFLLPSPPLLWSISPVVEAKEAPVSQWPKQRQRLEWRLLHKFPRERKETLEEVVWKGREPLLEAGFTAAPSGQWFQLGKFIKIHVLYYLPLYAL